MEGPSQAQRQENVIIGPSVSDPVRSASSPTPPGVDSTQPDEKRPEPMQEKGSSESSVPAELGSPNCLMCAKGLCQFGNGTQLASSSEDTDSAEESIPIDIVKEEIEDQ